MTPFDSPDFDDHEHVSFFRDAPAGLSAIIAIHSTVPIGVSGGGVRMGPYPSNGEALRDALRLSKAMSYKLALMGLPAGGAKAVIVGDPHKDKTIELLHAFGRALHRLGGKFIAGTDAGIGAADLRVIAEQTPFAVAGEGDSAESTARGVCAAIDVGLERFDRTLRGAQVVVQGVGSVGLSLARLLVSAGAEVTVCDVDRAAAERAATELEVAAVDPGEALAAECDVFSPCALGDVFDARTIPRLRCTLIAGSANNQLTDDRAADLLAEHGVLYCPDFVVNAGGILGAARQGAQQAGPFGSFFGDADRVGAVLRDVLDRAKRESTTPHAAAVAMAKAAIAKLRG